MTPTTAVASAGGRRIPARCRREQGRGAVTTTRPPRTSANRLRSAGPRSRFSAPAPASRAPAVPVPVLPGACSGRPVGAARAGGGARLVGRQVELPQRAERVDAARRRRGEGRHARRCGRPGRRTRRSRRPSPRPPGSSRAASRRSSGCRRRGGRARRARSGSRVGIRGAARRRRRGPPRRRCPRTPSWRPVSNARMTPPVVGPATRSTSRRAVASRCVARPRTRTARWSRPGPGGPGTSRGRRPRGARS